MIHRFGQSVHKTTGLIEEVRAVPLSHQYRLSDNALLLTYGGGSMAVKSSEDTIVYTNRSRVTTGFDTSGIVYSRVPRNARAKGTSNQCQHSSFSQIYTGDVNKSLRTDQTTNPVGFSSYYIDYSHHVTSGAAHVQAVAAAKAALATSWGMTFAASNAQSWINQGIAELRPDLTKVSVPNFMLELDDIPKMFQVWKKNLAFARNAAGGYLNLSFGWAPFLGDLQAIFDVLFNIKTELNNYKRSVGQIFHRHKIVFRESEQVSGTSTFLSETATKWHAELQHQAEVHVVYSTAPIQGLNDLDVVIRGLLQGLGIYLNPKIVWDNLPFTFVLDWFFGIGGFLNKFRVDALSLPIVLTDCYIQYKQTLVVTSGTTITDGRSDFSPHITSAGWETREKVFSRIPIWPNDDWMTGLGWKIPSPKQIRLLVSLATVLAPGGEGKRTWKLL